VIHGGARHVLSVAVTVREIELHEAGLEHERPRRPS
jgi:hypothetical protein